MRRSIVAKIAGAALLAAGAAQAGDAPALRRRRVMAEAIAA